MASIWNAIGRLKSDCPDAVGLPAARADDQDGASSWHCMEICEREREVDLHLQSLTRWGRGWPCGRKQKIAFYR